MNKFDPIKARRVLENRQILFSLVPTPAEIAELWSTKEAAKRKPLRAALDETSLQLMLDAGFEDALPKGDGTFFAQVEIEEVNGLEWQKGSDTYLLNIYVRFPIRESFSPRLYLSAAFYKNQTGSAQFCATEVCNVN